MRRGRRSTGWNKGDETVGVCNCSGFNALLMADGTRDWGNGLHQMSLLARGEGEREEKRRKEYSKRHLESVGDTWSLVVTSTVDFVCSFLSSSITWCDATCSVTCIFMPEHESSEINKFGYKTGKY